MKHTFSKVLTTCFLLCFAKSGLAQSLSDALDGIRTISYSEDSIFDLGDTLSASDPSRFLNRCIEYDSETDVKLDTQGSTSSSISVRFIGSSADLETELKYSFSAHATSKVTIADLGDADTSIKNFGKFENFIKRERDTAVLVIEAHAKHGREFINDFSFGAKYQGYIDQKNMDEFHRQCGTHFIRGENSQSSVRILFRFTGVDQSLKTIFENTLETSAKANLKVSDIGGGGSLTTSNKISALFRLASKLVDIEGDVDATGGLGVETLLKIVKGFDYSNPDEGLKNIFEELANVASDFSRENASPVNFIIAPFPIPDSTTVDFDVDSFNALGAIYKALIRVDQILEQYKDYEKQNYDIWTRYFRVRTEKIQSLRNKLVESFKNCRRDGNCDFDYPTEIEGVFLNDVIEAEVVQGLCSFGIAGPAVDLPSEGNLLSSVTVRVKGKMRFMEYTDLDAVEFLALGPDLEFKKMPVNFGEQFQLHDNPNDKESKFAFIDMFTGHFPKDVYEIGGQLDQDSLLAERAKAAKSIYLARIPLTSGWVVEDVFGYPNMKGCSLKEP